MKENRIKFYIIIFLGFSLLLNTNLGQVNGHEGETHDIATSYNTWKLLDWNEANTLEWFGKQIKIDAKIGSSIIYNVTSENKNNFTHPNSGLFSFGNTSNYETDNNDIALLLALSIYPWAPGLITEASNWTQIISEATLVAETSPYLKGSLSVDKSYQHDYKGSNRYAVKFDFVQDSPGNQNTSLIYDSETGILLYGSSEFYFSNLYKIKLELESSTLIIIPTTNTSGFELSILLMGIITLNLIRIQKRRSM